jgi:hypothetical protein
MQRIYVDNAFATNEENNVEVEYKNLKTKKLV